MAICARLPLTANPLAVPQGSFLLTTCSLQGLPTCKRPLTTLARALRVASVCVLSRASCPALPTLQTIPRRCNRERHTHAEQSVTRRNWLLATHPVSYWWRLPPNCARYSRDYRTNL